jgi:glycosyltransferase involved in cell wall biosynthesis
MESVDAMAMNPVLAVITPVYNDWPSFRQLLADLSLAAAGAKYRFRIIAVDDGSTDPMPLDLVDGIATDHLESLDVLRLAINMGHQRAIAIGMCTALENEETAQVLAMDADGEDRPSDIPHMLAASDGAPGCVLVARRAKRSERLLFRVFYRIYKVVFRVLTGKTVDFGNFSLLSREQAEQLTMVPELWNHLPAAIMRSRLRVLGLPIERGRRYAGTSKMSFVALTLHGMSAYSVYTDAILVRLLIGTILFTITSAVVSVVVVLLRLFTVHATPGWATTVVFGLGIIATQAMFTTLMSALLLLNARSQKTIVPVAEYRQYIRKRISIPLHHAE